MGEINERDTLIDSIHNALIDSKHYSIDTYRPKMVSNDGKGQIVLSTLERELRNCDSFDISVAFVTSGGLNCIYQELIELERKGIKGRFITTSFLSFNKPEDLRYLLNLENITPRVYDGDLHTKGYIFRKGDLTTALIGSSNLTQGALKENKEWNLRITSSQNGSLVKEISDEFDSLWEASVPLTDEWIEKYSLLYQEKQNSIRKSPSWNRPTIKPFKMQQDALDAIDALRKEGKKKALLVSATGTGKTYISAFDVKKCSPKRMLFLIHREKILDDAMESYKNVLGDRTSYGKYMGNTKEDGDYLFASIQTLARNLDKFDPYDFDYIVCDEVHHVVSKQYLSIINHFKPKFMLGMTATPERMDGADVFEIFDYNIAYEIRLQHALENKLVAPFHYFGIADFSIDGEEIVDKTKFSILTSDERVRHITNAIRKYPISGKKRKCLVFCSTNEESAELCSKFNEIGLCSISLSGEDPESKRVDAIDRLEDPDDTLNFIFTRDIFNEGVDIPTVNQIVMLRPTQSVVVFVQQLGRGLRKVEGKEFVTVLDFIGNYENNYMIPLALFGDKSCNKDNARRNMIVGNNQIPGASTISFDEISKTRIFESINSAKISNKKMLESGYLDAKYKLGHSPTLCDLYKGDGIDPRSIILSKLKIKNELIENLNQFRWHFDKDKYVELTEKQDACLSLISKHLLDAKRPIELEMVSELILKGSFDLECFKKNVNEKYGLNFPDDSYTSAIGFLTGGFLENKEDEKYLRPRLLEIDENNVRITNEFDVMMSVDVFKEQLMDVVTCGEMIFDSEYRSAFDGYLTLNKKYSRKDVSLLLNLGKNLQSVLNGYPKVVYNGFCPIFVTYSKSDHIDDGIRYQDEFIDRSTFSWMTRHSNTTNSDEVKNVIFADRDGTKLPLFVKKSDGEGSDFYYLGLVHPIPESVKDTFICDSDGREKPIVNIRFKLENAVREDIFEYLTT